MKLIYTLTALFIYHLDIGVATAQTAKVYRASALLGTFSTVDSAIKKATNIGDSVLLSAHTFYEHDIILPGGLIIQGTINATDTTIIDAEKKGIIFKDPPPKGRARVIRDVICQNGGNSGLSGGGDTLKLKGRTIVRYCHSPKYGGGIDVAFLYDHVKITHNTADSFGGGVGQGAWAYDSAEICYNTSRIGGGVGYMGAGGFLVCNSQSVRIHHNVATVGGGGIYGNAQMTAGQITDNQAPLGAAFYTSGCKANELKNVYIYNLLPSGNRQNEIYAYIGSVLIEGSWFGKSDTTGLIKIRTGTFCAISNAVIGKYAIANWSVNRGKALTKKDTLFPVGAAFTYNDGAALPANSLPWLQGTFSSSTGKVLTPNPKMSPADTLSSMFRSYVYPTKGDTTSKFINFLCSVDADTFRSSPRVWGIDSIALGIKNEGIETQVKIYPNPAKDVLHIDGAALGSEVLLYDVLGKLLKSEALKMNNTTIDISGIPAGDYLLKIRTKEGGEGTAKIMVND